jgi:hypothetical protein
VITSDEPQSTRGKTPAAGVPSARQGSRPAGADQPAYVVVARERRAGRAQRGADWRATSKQEWLPVGSRHAVPAAPRTLHAQAICGADIREWHTFWEAPFAAVPGSTCQRCLQVLVRSGVRLTAPPKESPLDEE